MDDAPDTASAPARRALVTGASSGIGAAFARRLAGDGYDLVVVARNRATLEELAAECAERHAVEIEVLPADLTRPAERRLVEERLAADPGFELLVNNAGFGTAGRFAESDVEREDEEIALNVVALVRLARAALGPMLARGRGAIVNVSSLAGLGPYPYTATYGASKAFVNSFSEALAEELRGSGVRIQALLPGFTRTEFQQRAGIDASTVPSFAWLEPADVVDASLAGLARGEVVCIPGRGYQVLAGITGLLPRAAFRRIVGAFQSARYGGAGSKEADSPTRSEAKPSEGRGPSASGERARGPARPEADSPTRSGGAAQAGRAGRRAQPADTPQGAKPSARDE